MVLVNALVPDQTYVALAGLPEEMYLVLDVAVHPDGVQHWVRLDKRCAHSAHDNFVAIENICAIFYQKN